MLSSERFNEVVRFHWGVENCLHWRLNVVMNEDHARNRLGNGAHNLAVLRHMALNVMQKDATKGSFRGKLKRAGTTPTSRAFWPALIRRGSLTVWVTEEAVAAWDAPATGEGGGHPIYSAIAIETCLALRLVFHQLLRQTEGLMQSIANLLGVDIAIPDHTTLSRRGSGLRVYGGSERNNSDAARSTYCRDRKARAHRMEASLGL